MKTVGHRIARPLVAIPTRELLEEGARFNEAIAALAGRGSGGFVPKGVYRFRTHAEANEHAMACLVRGMAALARERQQ